jgi:16S rRNA (guanine527-N7)-methyltransferase
VTGFSVLTAVTERLGIQLDAQALDRLARYRELLLDANSRFNLTRITDPDEIETRLFGESLALLTHVPPHATTLLDLGSGGGVPGLPLAIARPDLRVVLLDATAKKVAFLAETARELGLERVTALQGRAEEIGRNPQHRDHYDVVTARAVARLVTLVELALPLLVPGGVGLFPKGAGADEEVDEARYAVGMLGGRARPVISDAFTGTRLVAIDKRRPTPAAFPRRTGVPHKSPLLGPGHGAN